MTTVESRAWTLPELITLADNSLDTIVSLQDPSGAYPASPSFSAYKGYSWFRDGAFIADGVSAWGGVESASRFHAWCARILVSRRAQIERIVATAAAGTPVPDTQMLPTRFTFEGAEGNDEWWDFQLDGYGTWLWAVVEHTNRHGVSTHRWQPAIDLAVDYLVSSWSRPCFDWWEEQAEDVHVSTLGCIAAGLRAAGPILTGERAHAAQLALQEILALIRKEGSSKGHLSKWLGSPEVDASLLAIIRPLDVFDAGGSIGSATIAAIDTHLNIDGGVHRYAADTFFGGGQWPLLSCFLGLTFLATGDRDRALDQLRWAASTATPDFELPEQVDDHLLAPHMRQEWVDRWGTVATPLLWSHGMFLRLAADLELKVHA